MTRSWRMFAGRAEHIVSGREFLDFDADERGVRAHGRSPVAVELTEDPRGHYWGWIDSPEWENGYGRGDGAPVMIQPHKGMFSMQFAYGPKAEVDRGRGEIVRMSCRAVDDA